MVRRSLTTLQGRNDPFLLFQGFRDHFLLTMSDGGLDDLRLLLRLQRLLFLGQLLLQFRLGFLDGLNFTLTDGLN